jgi:hypothetical protein
LLDTAEVVFAPLGHALLIGVPIALRLEQGFGVGGFVADGHGSAVFGRLIRVNCSAADVASENIRMSRKCQGHENCTVFEHDTRPIHLSPIAPTTYNL